jgi:hypothetical protein
MAVAHEAGKGGASRARAGCEQRRDGGGHGVPAAMRHRGGRRGTLRGRALAAAFRAGPPRLRDLPALVVAPQQRHVRRPPRLEQQQQREHLRRRRPSAERAGRVGGRGRRAGAAWRLPRPRRRRSLARAASHPFKAAPAAARRPETQTRRARACMRASARACERASRLLYPRSTKSPMNMYDVSGTCPPVSNSRSRSWNWPWMSPHTWRRGARGRGRRSGGEGAGRGAGPKPAPPRRAAELAAGEGPAQQPSPEPAVDAAAPRARRAPSGVRLWPSARGAWPRRRAAP